jgi:hypothetical protein
MELLTESKMSKTNPIPVIGVESSNDPFCRTAECAYYKAEARGFEPGHEMDDWLTAEAEVLK